MLGIKGKWLLLGGGTVILAAAVAASVVGLLFLRAIDRPGEATAKFVPEDAPVYVSFNFRPGLGQIDRAREVISLLKTEELIELRDDFLEAGEDESGIHLLDDVRPWLDTDVSFVLLEADPEPAAVLMAHVSDEDAALDFAKKLIAYTDGSSPSSIGTWEDQVWKAEFLDGSIVAIDRASDYLLIGDSRGTVTDMVAWLETPPERALAQDPDFIEARRSLPEGRVMFTFAQTDALRDYLGEGADLFDLRTDTDTALDSIEESIPDYVRLHVLLG